MSANYPTGKEIELKYHIINKYRNIISERYDEIIDNIENTGIGLSPEVAREIKKFFFENIYPDPVQRRKLDAAFEELAKFTTNPALIWGLLGSLPVAIMQFGRHLPQAIRAGLTSLQAYTSAIGFEDAMLQAAIEHGFTEPMNDEQFFECLRSIPRRSLDLFINEASTLFSVISESTLLSKTINIMTDVVNRMKCKPHLYTSAQVAAIELGLDLMIKGNELLKPYSGETRKDIITFITKNEVQFLDEIHK